MLQALPAFDEVKTAATDCSASAAASAAPDPAVVSLVAFRHAKALASGSRRLGGFAPAVVASAATARPPLSGWLGVPGSLSVQLEVAHGGFGVQRLREGASSPWDDELALLGLQRSQALYSREVVLWGGGAPRVFARSTTTLAASQGPWRAVRGLGQQPLGSLLFSSQKIRRSALRAERLLAAGPVARAVSQRWHQAVGGTGESRDSRESHESADGDTVRAGWWRRHSVFWRGGAPLLVCEFFNAGQVKDWPARWHA